MTTVTDVERALIQARELEEYWRNEGWQSLQLEKQIMSAEIVDIHPRVQPSTSNTDPEVRVYIELETNIYEVPIEDVEFS
jgi:autotransporter translocation and assembly factor TamB